MEVVRSLAQLKSALLPYRNARASIGFVPTMGALHAGHLSLLTHAKAHMDCSVVSIFVNPKQFGPKEDFANYPRQEEQDLALLAQHQATIVYLPEAQEIYPPNHQTSITIKGLSERWCGENRPGHFDGVALIVTKLLLQVLPQRAYFGEKDFQQLVIIKRLVTDLNLPVDIEGVPTLREESGLALSSRNAYLSPKERLIAPQLYRTLLQIKESLLKGGDPVESCTLAREELLLKGFEGVDYVGVCHPETLEPLPFLQGEARILAAVRLGKCRLIDNLPIFTQ